MPFWGAFHIIKLKPNPKILKYPADFQVLINRAGGVPVICTHNKPVVFNN
jgi:hypothetical protein